MLQPVPGNPAAVQQRIASGELLKVGDHVVVLSKDGRTHDFNVTSISASTIEGSGESNTQEDGRENAYVRRCAT